MQADLEAQAAERTYEGWLSSLRGVFALAVETPDPTLRAVRSRYLAQAKALGSLTIDRLRTQLRGIAKRYDESPESVTFAIEQVKAQVMRDIAIGLESLRKLAIEIQLTVGRRANFVTALLRARRSRVTDLHFEYTDRIGRKWTAARYIRTLVRQQAVTLSIVSALRRIASSGADLARLEYPDPDRDEHGLVFSISGATAGYPSYRELEERGVFHPNTNVKVVLA